MITNWSNQVGGFAGMWRKLFGRGGRSFEGISAATIATSEIVLLEGSITRVVALEGSIERTAALEGSITRTVTLEGDIR